MANTRRSSRNKSKIQETESTSKKRAASETNHAQATTKKQKSASHDSSRDYWLMKAEPESRLEKGVDVKFSIDDLAKVTEPELWDGIRNYVARNNIRAMQKDDLAFFYHSNCKVPGVVGIMRIVEEASPDESAHDPKHPYYDASSTPENPKWSKVKVSFVQKFSRIIPLVELKSHMNGPLANMQALKTSRLSVSKVSPQEWEFILGLEHDFKED